MTMAITQRTLKAMAAIEREQAERHAWLFKAGEQIRRWKAEDAANGEPWERDRESE